MQGSHLVHDGEAHCPARYAFRTLLLGIVWIPAYMIRVLPQQPCAETDLRTSSDESKRPDSSSLGSFTSIESLSAM